MSEQRLLVIGVKPLIITADDSAATLQPAFIEGRKFDHNLWRLPASTYRGAWFRRVSYKEGDVVSFGGKLWLARASTRTRPRAGKWMQLQQEAA